MTDDDIATLPPLCDRCAAVAAWLAYAAYDVPGTDDSHPSHRRYPQPMVRACAVHLAVALSEDGARPGTTRQWIVVPAVLPLRRGGWLPETAAMIGGDR